MAQTYSFQRLKKSNLNETVTLVNQIFRVNINKNYLEWKYFKNPAGQTLSVVILFDGRVVGLTGAIPMRFLVGAIEVTGVQEVDAAIFEDYRRLDVYMNMGGLLAKTYIEENVAFTYGITNNDSSELNQITGKKQISPIPRLVKVLNTRPFFAKKLSDNMFLKIISLFIDTILNLRYPWKVVIPRGMRIKQIDHFDERFDALWSQIKGDYPIMSVRDTLYLNWRYADSSVMNYEIVSLEQIESNKMIGFIVLGERKKGDIYRGQILEIITSKKSESIISQCLLRFAVNRFRQMGADAIECWMFSHCHVYPELIKMGFMPREKRGLNLDFQRINSNSSSVSQDILKKKENWYISSGDSDIR